ncbi:MAG: DNA repair protein RecO [Granulosicoccus sp.]
MHDASVSTSLQPGYILHYREYQESSFIVDAFTLTHGRVALMAKSARNSRPQIRALYQPFRPLLLSWVGAGDLRTLTGIEESGPALNLTDVRLACGYYINELVLRLLGKDQPQDEVFAFFSLALSELEQLHIGYEVVLRTFELQLLDTLGVLPDLPWCTPDGKQILPEHEYLYHPANAVAVPLPDSADLGLMKEKHRTNQSSSSMHPDGMTLDEGVRVHGKTLIAMHELDFGDAQVLSECRTLMRQILRVQLGDRPLKSRELFTALATKGRD